MTVNLLDIAGVKNFNKNFANLQVDVSVAEKIGREGGIPFPVSL